MNIAKRLKEERDRLRMTQSEFGALGDAGKTTVIAWERGTAFPNAAYLAAIAAAGADVQYIVTGERRGQGLGESGVHQAVLDAVDLLSLAKKVDADQLARAVVKLCARHLAPAPASAQVQNVASHGGPVTQTGDIATGKRSQRMVFNGDVGGVQQVDGDYKQNAPLRIGGKVKKK